MLSEENQRIVQLLTIPIGIIIVYAWMFTIPNGDYILSPAFRSDLRMELSYVPQIWGIRKHGSSSFWQNLRFPWKS